MKYDVCVIGGAGHVGLPLSVALASKGQKVVVYDLNDKALAVIESGKMPFMEKDAEPVLQSVIRKTLSTTTNPDVIGEAKFVVVVIGTPVDEHLNPMFRTIKRFFDTIIPHLKKGQILILRSTLFPGTTHKVAAMLKKQKVGVEVCFCPERIAEGKAMEELFDLPQIVSGTDKKAVKEVAALFKLLTPEILELETMEAELAKLFTNSWRYMQFATANQFYMLAEEYGADFHRIHKAMTYKYPRTKDFPRPGFAAGPCLFKDTMQLSAFSNNKFFLGHSAMLVNEGLPNFIVSMLKKHHDISEKTVGILGMAFKAESDDGRESLSYKLRKILEIEADTVLCSDVYIKAADFVSEADLLKRCDVVIIGAPHDKYKTLKFKGKTLIDVWNCVPEENK